MEGHEIVTAFRKLDMEGQEIVNATINDNGIRRFRKVPPAHYTFEIESFSSLLETKVEKYETKDFEAGGYKWRMVLYPNGKNKEDGSRDISLFLEMAEPADVSLNWEVNVMANFFVFDGIRDRYLMVQDGDMVDWRFHKMKMEWGLTEFISHDALRDPSTSFLVNDRCVFGVEVFVIGRSGEGESLSFVEEPADGLYTWKIDNFSALKEFRDFSEVFTVEGRKWKLEVYPKGDLNFSGTHLSLFLKLDESETLETKRKLCVKWSFSIKDQSNRYIYHKPAEERWFAEPGQGWGFGDFMLLSDLNDPSKGFLVNDCIIIEAKFDIISALKDFS